MKTDNNKGQTRHAVSLQQLLGTLEHAGRDKRRQEEIGAMIDGMAGAESGEWRVESGEHRHGAWWWTVRVAAAACVFFFIVTAVRIWFIPTENSGRMVAEAEVPAPPQPLTKNLPRTYQELTNDYRGGRRKVVEEPLQESFAEDEAEMVEVAEVLADNEAVEEAVDTVEEFLVVNDDMAAELEEPQVDAEPEQPLQPVPPEPVAAQPQERKRSLLGGLIRRAEPSKMDGTMLAINIL